MEGHRIIFVARREVHVQATAPPFAVGSCHLKWRVLHGTFPRAPLPPCDLYCWSRTTARRARASRLAPQSLGASPLTVVSSSVAMSSSSCSTGMGALAATSLHRISTSGRPAESRSTSTCGGCGRARRLGKLHHGRWGAQEGAAWAQHGRGMGVAWVRHGCGMGAAWVQHGRGLGAAWACLLVEVRGDDCPLVLQRPGLRGVARAGVGAGTRCDFKGESRAGETVGASAGVRVRSRG